MSGQPAGSEPDDRANGSWTSETLPISVRKEMLQRELNRLGFRKAGQASSHPVQQQQQSQPSSAHPQADEAGEAHGD